MTVRQNLNLDTLENFRSFLKDNPEKGRLHLEAKAVYQGQAGQSVIHIGRFGLDDTVIDRPTRQISLPFGAGREVAEMVGMEGGEDDMEPVEMALASTAACLIHSITLNAIRLGIDASGLEITVRTTVDPRVLFLLKTPEDHGESIGSIEYDVKVAGSVSDEDLETIHRLCRYSPVHAMMSQAVKITGDVTRA